MALKMTLSPSALGWLGGAFEEKSRISPLSNFDAGGFTSEERHELIKQGVLDPEGKVAPGCYAAMEALARANSYSRLRFSGGLLLVEKIVYFNGATGISLENTPGGLVVEYPAHQENTLTSLSQFIGTSQIVNSELYAELDFEAALVLAAIVDMYRRDVLKACTEYIGFRGRPYTAGEIVAAVQKAPDNPQWIVSLLKKMKGVKKELDEQGVERALEVLGEKGCVLRRPGGCELVGEAAVLGGTFLIVEQVAQLECGRETPAGDITLAECVCLQSGLHDLLYIDGGGGRVTMEAISASMLLDYIRQFLTAPPVLA
ncbi:MAG: hypothetical protein M1598_03330 [Actinobacteria bacterium]|nr:hypothetical protein [Actinomycetota bacterium]